MGFFDSLASGLVKTVCTPIAIAKDVVDVTMGNNPDNTKKLIESALEDFEDAID